MQHADSVKDVAFEVRDLDAIIDVRLLHLEWVN